MAKCTLCGQKKGWMAGGWEECPSCASWYCKGCKDRLKTKGMVFKKKVCVRCGSEL